MERFVAIAIAAVVCGLSIACNATSTPPAANDPACSAPPKCTADPPPPPDQIDACDRALASRCGPQYRAYLDCAAKNVTCDSGGRSDPAAIDAACSDESSAYDACVGGPPDAAH